MLEIFRIWNTFIDKIHVSMQKMHENAKLRPQNHQNICYNHVFMIKFQKMNIIPIFKFGVPERAYLKKI